jgi:hypothetical protein
MLLAVLFTGNLLFDQRVLRAKVRLAGANHIDAAQCHADKHCAFAGGHRRSTFIQARAVLRR